MTNEEYLDTQNKLVLFTTMFEGLDLKDFIEAAEKADTIAPIVDPTLWMKGHAHLDAIKALAHAARWFQTAAGDFHATMAALDAKGRR